MAAKDQKDKFQRDKFPEVSADSSKKYNDLNLNQNSKDISHLTVQSHYDPSKRKGPNTDYDVGISSKNSSATASKKTAFSPESQDLFPKADGSDKEKPIKLQQMNSSTDSIATQIRHWEEGSEDTEMSTTKKQVEVEAKNLSNISITQVQQNPFSFGVQQQLQDGESTLSQFHTSAKLLNPNSAIVVQNQEVDKSTMELDDDREDSLNSPKLSSNSGSAETSDFELSTGEHCGDSSSEESFGEEGSGEETSDFELSDDETAIEEKPITKPKDKNKFSEEDMVDFMGKLESSTKTAHHSSAYEIYKQYEELEGKLPQSIKLPAVSDTLFQPCCAEMCCSKFTVDFVKRARLRMPTSSIDLIHYFQFFCMQNCTGICGNFSPKINEIPICEEFFRRLYAIPKDRFNRFTEQLSTGLTEPLPHGNKGKSFEHASTSSRVAQMINQIDTMAEEHPGDTSYLMPAGTTKSDIVKLSNLKSKVKINPTQEIARIDQTFRFHKSNSHTMCNTCTQLKTAIKNSTLSAEDRKEAKQHLRNHYANIKNDRRDYTLRKLMSLRELHYLLSLGHDGMSKNLSKVPSLLNFNTKKLADATRMMCSLNLGVVHRKSPETPYQLHCFWNIDQIFGAGANSVISQLFYIISQCDPIPPNIAIQLDNCASNKCYTLLGSFGLLLLWIPELDNIYVCTSEVGHTHNDVDQKFGILATALEKEEVYTPQGFKRFTEAKLKGLATNNLLPTTYDFDSLIHKNVNQTGLIAKNHLFELSKQEDNTVTIKIARFLRSEKYLAKSSQKQEILFKIPPNVNEYPKIIPPKEFDTERHEKICKAVNGSIPSDDYEELLKLPNFIAENYLPEPFKDLLKRISDKVVASDINVTVPDDPDGELAEAFLQRIKKPWDASNSTLAPSQEHSSGQPTIAVENATKQNKSRKRKSTSVEASRTPSASKLLKTTGKKRK